MKKFLFLLSGITLIFFAPYGVQSIRAATPLNNLDIGFLSFNYTAGSDIGAYIQTFYNFALGISGGLAMIMIVYGGIRYATSAGKPDVQNDARDAIYSALFGIVLLFGAVLLLKTVNPQIIKLSTKIDNPSSCTTAGQVYCLGTPTSTSRCMPRCALNANGEKQVFKEDCSGCKSAFISCPLAVRAPSSCPGMIILTEELSNEPGQVVKGFAPNLGQTITNAQTWPKILAGVYQDARPGIFKYYDEDEIIWKFSKIWTYPYYDRGDPTKTTSSCIIYARKEPEGGGRGGFSNTCSGSRTGYCEKYDDVKLIDLYDGIKPC